MRVFDKTETKSRDTNVKRNKKSDTRDLYHNLSNMYAIVKHIFIYKNIILRPSVRTNRMQSCNDTNPVVI